MASQFFPRRQVNRVFTTPVHLFSAGCVTEGQPCSARVLLPAHCGILRHRGSCWRRQSGDGIRRFADCGRTKGAGNHVTLLRRRGGGRNPFSRRHAVADRCRG